MRKKKIFGIGAAFLMILVVIVPVINGLQINNKNQSNTNGSKWDLKVTLEDAEFQRLNPDGDKVVYLMQYVVENVGTGIYWGSPETKLMPKDSIRVLASWNEERFGLFPSPPNNKKTFVREVEISCEDEKFIAGKDVQLETGKIDEGGGLDPSALDNKGFGFGKYWKNLENNGPTKYQLRASVPKDEWIDYADTYNGKTINIDRKIPLFNSKYTGGVLPSLAKSNRLGWIIELAEYLNDILKDIGAMVTLSAAYVTLITPSVYIILDWLQEIFTYTAGLANGVVIPGRLSQLFNKFINDVWPEIEKVIVETIAYFGVMLKEINDFVDHCEALKEWESTNPWLKDINIDIALHFIDLKDQNKKVRVICRNFDNEMDINTGSASFSISVASDIIEDDSKKPHNCTIIVQWLNGDGTVNKELTSRPILSYVFSNGTLFWSFTFKGSKPPSREFNYEEKNIRMQIYTLLREWINNKSFSNNFFEKMIIKTI